MKTTFVLKASILLSCLVIGLLQAASKGEVATSPATRPLGDSHDKVVLRINVINPDKLPLPKMSWILSEGRGPDRKGVRKVIECDYDGKSYTCVCDGPSVCLEYTPRVLCDPVRNDNKEIQYEIVPFALPDEGGKLVFSSRISTSPVTVGILKIVKVKPLSVIMKNGGIEVEWGKNITAETIIVNIYNISQGGGVSPLVTSEASGSKLSIERTAMYRLVEEEAKDAEKGMYPIVCCRSGSEGEEVSLKLKVVVSGHDATGQTIFYGRKEIMFVITDRKIVQKVKPNGL